MRTDRQNQFAVLEGLLLSLGVSSSHPAFKTLKKLESKVGNMTSEQVALIGELIGQALSARDAVAKQRIITTIEKLEL